MVWPQSASLSQKRLVVLLRPAGGAGAASLKTVLPSAASLLATAARAEAVSHVGLTERKAQNYGAKQGRRTLFMEQVITKV